MTRTSPRLLAYAIALLVLPCAALGARDKSLPATDPLLGDSRLETKRSVHAVNATMRDLLADLNIQTGIRFFADRAVADDRVTLIAHDRPLAETMRAIADLFQFAWKREGASGDYGYTLWQTEASRAAEQAEVDTRAEASVDLIRQEAAAFARFRDISTDDARAKGLDIAPQTTLEKDPVKRRALRVDYSVLAKLEDRSDWTRVVYRVLDDLPRERLLSMMRGGTVEFGWPSLKGYSEFSPDVIAEMRRMRPETAGSSLGNGDLYDVRLRFTGDPGREPRLRWQLNVGRRHLAARAAFQYIGAAPFTILPASSDALAQAEPADWKNDPALTARVSVTVPAPPSPGGPTQPAPTPAAKPPVKTLGLALDAIDRFRPTDLIADAFWSTRIAGIDLKNVPLGEALTSLARMTGHRWWKSDGFVCVRSLNYAIDRGAEPPAISVSRWAQHASNANLTVDDYAEIAVLPDPKYATLNQMALNGAFPAPLYPVSQGRQHLALWRALTRSQRRQAASEGVWYSKMTPAQEKLFVRAVSDPAYTVPTAYLTQALLDTARVRIQNRETRLWGVRAKGRAEGQMSGAASREEALQYFSQIDPQLRLSDVVPYVTDSVSFLYDCDRGYFARGVVTLPPRWAQDRD